jgi:hypothetical protein
MSPEQKRKFNSAFGTFFLVSGIAAWGLATYFAVTPNPPKPAPVFGGTTVDLRSCASTLRTLGYLDVDVQKNEVTAHEALSQNPHEQLDRATLAASVCHLEMKYFCIGEACPKPGLTIVSASMAPSAQKSKKRTSPTSNDSSVSPPAAKARKAPLPAK